MKNDEIQKIINHYRNLTKDIPDLVAINALDLPRDFAIIDLSALAGAGHIETTTCAVLYAAKLGFAAGKKAESKARTAAKK